MAYLWGLKSLPCPHSYTQEQGWNWLENAHLKSEEHTSRKDFSLVKENFIKARKLNLDIQTRNSVLEEFKHTHWQWGEVFPLDRLPQGIAMDARMAVYQKKIMPWLAKAYPHKASVKTLLHVSCTGYVAPSAPQEYFSGYTDIFHAYHMGCYAALPALKIAKGLAHIASPAAQPVDIFHTELCTLHLNPADHRLEQLLVQNLFADGAIHHRVGIQPPPGEPCFKIGPIHSQIVPDSAQDMTWLPGPFQMLMTLSSQVPLKIKNHIAEFAESLLPKQHWPETVFAIHPGGPKIIDWVQRILKLNDGQVEASRRVLRHHGNMSSATLPHVWEIILNENKATPPKWVVSMAFGPGLSLWGCVFEGVSHVKH